MPSIENILCSEGHVYVKSANARCLECKQRYDRIYSRSHTSRKTYLSLKSRLRNRITNKREKILNLEKVVNSYDKEI